MASDESVTSWVRQLAAGNEDAALHLWRRYFNRLVGLARAQLGAARSPVADEEDVALSVFRRLCDGAARGQLAGVGSRDELWRLLVVMTAHRVIDQRRYLARQMRDGGADGDNSILPSGERIYHAETVEGVIGDEPTPDFLTTLADEHQRLMDLLADERLRQIAAMKLEGYENPDIAGRLGLSRRTIERKLGRIRQAWSQASDR